MLDFRAAWLALTDEQREQMGALMGETDEIIERRLVEEAGVKSIPMVKSSPLIGRPGLIQESAEVNYLAKDLGQFAKRHGLRGCVLISFTDERVGVNSSGEPDLFGRHMEQLGDRLLAAIDDGKFDPVSEPLPQPEQSEIG